MNAARSLRLASIAVALCGATPACNGELRGGGNGAAATGGSAGGKSGASGASGSTGGGAGTGAAAGSSTAQDAAAGGDAVLAPDGPNKAIVLAVVTADGMALGGVASFAVTVMQNGSARMRTFDHDRGKA